MRTKLELLAILLTMSLVLLFSGPRDVQAAQPVQAAIDLGVAMPGTANPLGAVITPSANITLVANTRQQIPGSYCSITIWNSSTTEPVYWGGSTVTTALGLAICNNGSLCPSPVVSIDVKNQGGIWLISTNALAGVRYALGTGC